MPPNVFVRVRARVIPGFRFPRDRSFRCSEIGASLRRVHKRVSGNDDSHEEALVGTLRRVSFRVPLKQEIGKLNDPLETPDGHYGVAPSSSVLYCTASDWTRWQSRLPSSHRSRPVSRAGGDRRILPHKTKEVSSGDDNTAHVLLVQATGSGARANRYAHSSIPLTGSPGIGNRLEIVGNANAFDRTNQNIVPPPPAEFFTGGH
jgi:hypothetical protein